MEIFNNLNVKMPDKELVEIVERKGLGHPDTMSDYIAEMISIEYSKFCIKHFGVILHHNVDKVTVMGGLAEINWGKGAFVEPVRVLVNGRLSNTFENKSIPIKKIVKQAVKKSLLKILPRLDLTKNLVIIYESTQYSRNCHWFKPRTVNDLPEYKKIFANDTSAVVGFWPLTLAETLSLELEALFYNKDTKPKFSYIGQDIKVMIIRKKETFNITMCIPFFAQEVSSFNDYLRKKSKIETIIRKKIEQRLGKNNKYLLFINTQDQNIEDKTSVKKLYFVAGGSSTDFGEEGCVGRGNNRRGLIPMMRTHSMEAAYGKNPVYHVGKVYGLIVDTMAKMISEHFNCPVEVMIVTKNGDPFFEPHQIIVSTSQKLDTKSLKAIVLKVLSQRDWTKKIVYKDALLPKISVNKL